MWTALGTECGLRSREESMAAGSLWFLGAYLSYWERRIKKVHWWSLESVVNPIFSTPSAIFMQ